MSESEIAFADLGLKNSILNALHDLGYEKPSPIQAACIPYLLSGRDVLGMAQTGSGKTAAFSLPLLHNIKVELAAPQVLVLTPTRELAIQVGKACVDFAKHMQGINIVVIYGGQRYDVQLHSLRKGPQVVIGTPGRLLDHLKRSTLNLSNLTGLVLDEADEMLRMGFIEDVESILTQLPKEYQTVLFSATMPKAIHRITRRFMREPQEICIESSITTSPNIYQSYWLVCGIHKNEALVRFLEAEDFDAAIIFVRTKNTTLEVDEVLKRNGYSSAALNGDMNQSLREHTLSRLRDGHLDILIATDVASRGLDVDRISLVINYDIPMDSESYVHRIGRTGRAGRAGRALLFVQNNERRLLHNIELSIKRTIPKITLPTTEILSNRRLTKFAAKVQNQLKSKDIDMYRALLTKLYPTEESDIKTLAAALLKIAQGERPLILPKESKIENCSYRVFRKSKVELSNYKYRYTNKCSNIEEMDLYRIAIGRNDGVKIRHIINAITNKGDIHNHSIGNIKVFASYSTIELQKGIKNKVLSSFSHTRVLNKLINIQFLDTVRSYYFKRRKNIIISRNNHSNKHTNNNYCNLNNKHNIIA